ncbi:MAG: diaminopimelate epimerase [Desulfosarcinaceae bacterium]|nr:diaminopimelate epimerase [Desulfosarcinaceae bacterium]
MTEPTNSLPFAKMSGAGNDFIIIDNRTGGVLELDLPDWVRRICTRRISIGADGLLLIEPSPDEGTDFQWRFFNADGSVAEMCGNAARCVARYAFLKGIAAQSLRFKTIAGIIAAEVQGEVVKIKMTAPFDLVPQRTLKLADRTLPVGSVNTGVPHVVSVVPDVEAVDVIALGRAIRHHPNYQPAGTNANFVSRGADGAWSIRTYERGVEGETLACGTGNVAAAIVLAATQELESPVTFRTRSGSDLTVCFERKGGAFHAVYLAGDARLVYEGQMTADAWTF